VLARNVREGRGELDLVAVDRDTVVFVEVKFRAAGDRGSALDAVTAKKRADTARAAARWLAEHRATDRPVRFDVIGITWGADEHELHLQHVPNAFPGSGRHFF
jgi:putative endonuclease